MWGRVNPGVFDPSSLTVKTQCLLGPPPCRPGSGMGVSGRSVVGLVLHLCPDDRSVVAETNLR